MDRLIIDVLIEKWRKSYGKSCNFPKECHCKACELDAKYNFARIAKDDLTTAIFEMVEEIRKGL